MSELVPFGKYQGRAIEEMMVDVSYCEWLATQPWFKDRYTNIYNMIINYGGEPQDSPEHNALQGKFLDDAFCLQLSSFLENEKDRKECNLLFEEYENKVKKKQKELEEKKYIRNVCVDFKNEINDIHSKGFEEIFDVKFIRRIYKNVRYSFEILKFSEEHYRSQGANWTRKVSTMTDFHRKSEFVCKRENSDDWHYNEYKECPLYWEKEDIDNLSIITQEYSKTFGIECKPIVGDDYPKILRQIKDQIIKKTRPQIVYEGRNRHEIPARPIDHVVLVYEKFETTNMSLEQVKKIFELSGIKMVSVKEIEDAISS